MEKILKKIDPKKIELFLFDLDGTLYEDQDHFDYYAKCLAERLKPEKRDFFGRIYTLPAGETIPLAWEGYMTWKRI